MTFFTSLQGGCQILDMEFSLVFIPSPSIFCYFFVQFTVLKSTLVFTDILPQFPDFSRGKWIRWLGWQPVVTPTSCGISEKLQMPISNPNLYNPNLSLIGTYLKSPSVFPKKSIWNGFCNQNLCNWKTSIGGMICSSLQQYSLHNPNF